LLPKIYTKDLILWASLMGMGNTFGRMAAFIKEISQTASDKALVYGRNPLKIVTFSRANTTKTKRMVSAFIHGCLETSIKAITKTTKEKATVRCIGTTEVFIRDLG